MGPPANGVQYAMYDATYDPVPLLSNYENPLINSNLTPESILNGLTGIPSGDKNSIELLALYTSINDADQESWQQKLNTYINPHPHQYKGEIFNINDVGNVSNGAGVFHTINMNNHTQYTISDQLNARDTTLALPNIDPQSLGPTEYFGSYAPVS
jgi:hypothetical protein